MCFRPGEVFCPSFGWKREVNFKIEGVSPSSFKLLKLCGRLIQGSQAWPTLQQLCEWTGIYKYCLFLNPSLNTHTHSQTQTQIVAWYLYAQCNVSKCKITFTFCVFDKMFQSVYLSAPWFSLMACYQWFNYPLSQFLFEVSRIWVIWQDMDFPLTNYHRGCYLAQAHRNL